MPQRWRHGRIVRVPCGTETGELALYISASSADYATVIVSPRGAPAMIFPVLELIQDAGSYVFSWRDGELYIEQAAAPSPDAAPYPRVSARR